MDSLERSDIFVWISTDGGNISTTLPTYSEPDVESRSTAGKVIASCLLFIIMILSIVGNAAVILAILKTPRLREKTSNIFLINLAVTDLLNGSLVMPSTFVALLTDSWPLGTFWCYAQCAFNYLFIIVSMLTLSLISVDGYYAVNHPLRWVTIITPRVVKVSVCYAWIQGAVFASVPVSYRWVIYDYWEVVCAIDWDRYSDEGALTYVIFAFAICFLLPAIVMTICYSKICCVAKQKSVRPEVGGIGGIAGTVPAPKKKKTKHERRVIQSLALVVGIFFLCMTPFCVTKLVKIFLSTSSLPPYLYLVSSLFGYLASATNPFIYAIFRRDFRQAFKLLFCRKRIFPRMVIGRNLSPSVTNFGQTESRRQSRQSNNDVRMISISPYDGQEQIQRKTVLQTCNR